ncbi:MAG: PIF1 family DEAD/DEAH box helicase [Candidatus Pacebacteria bacterium]|nr:PIF1 family DEAD/DEAH box helicase [Candidatus Paceibacterota bacterium]
MKQEKALKILNSGKNVFLTGSAGTGKTFVLNSFIKTCKKRMGVTASTGIAATHLNGMTIHSWSGIGINNNLDEAQIKRLLKKKYLFQRMRNVETLIIDEISMLDAKRFDLVDKILKEVQDPFLPFGGVQIVVCGDFFQLPPINNWDNSFSYNAFAWEGANFKVCYLEDSYRQNEDREFIKILNKIRGNKMDLEAFTKLKEREKKEVEGFTDLTKLYSLNVDIDKINEERLSEIKEKERVYKMISSGEKAVVDALKRSCLAQETLRLKKGAIVMFIKNNQEAGYFNGSMGEVVDFNDLGNPIIKLKNGKLIHTEIATWIIEDQGESLAMIEQLPLRLAWAITIHKSQGMSLDAAEIDLSKTFEYGMGYVALSRVKTLKGIKLVGINKKALQVSPEIIEKDKEFRRLSEN